MTSLTRLCCGFAFAIMFAASVGHAQPRTGWMFQTNGLAAYQGDAGLSGGGDVTVTDIELEVVLLHDRAERPGKRRLGRDVFDLAPGEPDFRLTLLNVLAVFLASARCHARTAIMWRTAR